MVVDPGTGETSQATLNTFDILKEKWKIVGEFKSLEQAENIFDGDPQTAWTLNNNLPLDFIIDLGEQLNLKGFTYLPDQGRWNPGIIFNFDFHVSSNGKNWGQPVSKGEFPNIKNSPVLQEKLFDTIKGRFIKFRALSPAEENGRVGIAEIGIITE